MKRIIEQPSKSHHLLLIEYGFRNLIENNRSVGIGMREVKRGEISNSNVVEECVAFASMVQTSVMSDVENIKKCKAFIDGRFPHVVYSFDEFGINIDNLNEEEMKICALEPGLRFTYWLVDDQVGDPLKPSIITEEHLQQNEII